MSSYSNEDKTKNLSQSMNIPRSDTIRSNSFSGSTENHFGLTQTPRRSTVGLASRSHSARKLDFSMNKTDKENCDVSYESPRNCTTISCNLKSNTSPNLNGLSGVKLPAKNRKTSLKSDSKLDVARYHQESPPKRRRTDGDMYLSRSTGSIPKHTLVNHRNEIPKNRLTLRSTFHPGGFHLIECETLKDVMDGKYQSFFDNVFILDCRFQYEYNGGHISNAINIHDPDMIKDMFLEVLYILRFSILIQ
eukprot:TRINITY_DN1489_c0_g1_i3.p1 TRINITY_DN1489_c0_g1~~TRINITY_DN1489_c0_g1_i3.p1  ORF type:complete len:248 (-),score=25.63 TRINITY_DN1489_c0_g1_i3:404-1147(-)